MDVELNGIKIDIIRVMTFPLFSFNCWLSCSSCSHSIYTGNLCQSVPSRHLFTKSWTNCGCECRERSIIIHDSSRGSRLPSLFFYIFVTNQIAEHGRHRCFSDVNLINNGSRKRRELDVSTIRPFFIRFSSHGRNPETRKALWC
jgi:hypothetical protein